MMTVIESRPPFCENCMVIYPGKIIEVTADGQKCVDCGAHVGGGGPIHPLCDYRGKNVRRNARQGDKGSKGS